MTEDRNLYAVATIVVDEYDPYDGTPLSTTIIARSAMLPQRQALADVEELLPGLPGAWGSLTPNEIRDLHRRWEDRRIVLFTQLELF